MLGIKVWTWRPHCALAAVALAFVTTFAGQVQSAQATTYIYCDYYNGTGQTPGYWCTGPRHSLTYNSAQGYGGTATMCVTTQNPDGSFTATYCNRYNIVGGPYCGCVLRYPWDRNQELYTINMEGIGQY